MSKNSYTCGLCKFGNNSFSFSQCYTCDGQSNFVAKDQDISEVLHKRYSDVTSTNMRNVGKCLMDGFKAGFNGSINAKIKNVIFNDPATIVFWSDNTKTVVKTQNGEAFDPEKGLAMAIVKKALGNEGNYFNEIKKWIFIDVARFNANHTTNVGEFLVQTSMGEFYCTDEPLLPPNVDFEYSAKRIVIRTKKSKDKKDSK